MRIIIAGDGETGTHLARTLSVENQDIVLMGTHKDHLDELDAAGNIITFEGSALSRHNLLQCGADAADLFVAVTPDENANIIACLLAKDCGTRRCAARIDNPEFDTDATKALLRGKGVDITIYPEKLAAAEIARFIEHNWVSEWFRLYRGELLVVGVRMTSGGELRGHRLRDIPNTPRLFHIAAIRRGSGIIIPGGDDMLLEGDTVYFSVLPRNLDLLPALCGKTPAKVRRVMVTGAGHVTENLLELTAGRYDITVIDPDRGRCDAIAARFPGVVAVNAAANDVATLKDEGIGNCDMFLALTRSSETNIVSCMVAREHGVARTLARIEDLQYRPEAESLSIDKIINKKLLNAGQVLNALLDEGDAATQCMSLDMAEIAEIEAVEGSRIVSRPIQDLSLPKGLTVGGLIRDGAGQLVDGRTRVRPGDRVVLFCVSGSLPRIRRLFR